MSLSAKNVLSNRNRVQSKSRRNTGRGGDYIIGPHPKEKRVNARSTGVPELLLRLRKP